MVANVMAWSLIPEQAQWPGLHQREPHRQKVGHKQQGQLGLRSSVQWSLQVQPELPSSVRWLLRDQQGLQWPAHRPWWS